MLRRLLVPIAVALLAAPAAAHADKPDLLFSAGDPSAAGKPEGIGLGSGARDRWTLVKGRWYDVLVDYDVSELSGSARDVVVRGRGSGVDVRPRRLGERGRITVDSEGDRVLVPVRLTADTAKLQLVVTSSKGRLGERQVIELTAAPAPAPPQDGTWSGTAADGTNPVGFRVRDGRVLDLRAVIRRSCPFGEPPDELRTATFPDVRIPRVNVVRRTSRAGTDREARIDLRFPTATTAAGVFANSFDERCGGLTTFTAQRTGP